MNRVHISVRRIDAPAWLERFKRAAGRMLKSLSIDGQEISIVLCDDEFIRELNRDYRGKDEPTDVLSFAQDDQVQAGGAPLSRIARRTRPVGDIVISLPMVRSNAREFGVAEGEELKRLLIHGMLHLQGMDHKTNSQNEPMLRLQEEVVKSLTGVKIL